MPSHPETADPDVEDEAEAQRELTRQDAARFGVGARVTVAVMTDDYVRILTDALAGVDASGLAVQTGDVSTFVQGEEARLLAYLTDLGAAVAHTGEHAAITVHLSRGCPGGVVCEVPGAVGPREVAVPPGREVGAFAAGEWSLYPLADDVQAGVDPDHMRDIEAAITQAHDNGTWRETLNFVTRLEGDLGTVLATAVAGWVLAGRSVQHVASHLTLSVNSPSHADRRVSDG